MTYAQQIEELTNQYNAEIRSLEREYEMTCDDGGFFTNLSTHSTRRDFSDRYDMLARDYREKCRQLLERQKLANPAWAKSRKLGGWGGWGEGQGGGAWMRSGSASALALVFSSGTAVC